MSISSTSSSTTSTTTSTSSSFGYSNLMSAPTSGTTPGPNRITGLATGLDIDSLVKEEMMAKQQPIDQMMQREQLLTWQRDAYRGINTALSQFQTAAANLRYGFDFQAEKATSDNTSVSVTAGAQAVSGTYTMTVHQLATSASMVSSTALNLWQNPTQVVNSGQPITLDITGTSGTKAVTIAANSTINDVVNAINAQNSATGVTASYDTATDRFYLNSMTTGANSMISIAGADSASQSFLTNTLKIGGTSMTTVTGGKSFAPNAVVDSSLAAGTSDVFTINGQNITVTNTTTVSNLQDQIAKAGLSPDVTLSQDVNGNLMFQSTGTIKLADSTGTSLADMGLVAGTYNPSNPASVTGTTGYSDMNALINPNLGSTVSFTVDGKTMNISNTTTVSDLQTQMSTAGLTVTVGVDSSGHVKFNDSSNITLVDGSKDTATGLSALNALGMSASSTTTSVTGTVAMNPNNILVDRGLGSTISFQVNSKTVNISNTTTLGNLQSQINALGLNPPVTAGLDGNNHLLLNSSGSITLTDGSADATTGKTALQELGLTAGTTTGNVSGAALATGTDTIVDFNGVNGIHFHSSNFTVNNLTFSLTTPPAAGSSYTADVTVSQDTDTIYNNIKTFIDSYNTIVDTLYNKINEPKYYNYSPLTDAQKAQMSANDIDLWNQKAQSGMLQGDSTLQSTLDSLRNFMQDPVNNLGAGNYKMLSDIGITQLAPGTTNAYQDNGHLYINDTQLKQAIQTNPQQVIALFTTVPSSDLTSSTINTPDDNQGIAERMYRVVANSMSSITTIAGTAGSLTDNSSLGLQITDLTNQITDADSKLAGYQQQYYSQFAQLESAINNFNSQKQYLASAFGGGSSSGG